ncbi:hypothetical protein JW998_05990 [candidate division KSB1 bacterium]|nr:hypothetical protein [candidate division KSB1 bacterium]
MDYMMDARQQRRTQQGAVTIVLPVESIGQQKGLHHAKRSKPFTPDLLYGLNDSAMYDFQRILENILSLRQTHNMQIIGMTSAHSNEGTSTVIGALSLLAAARQNHQSHNAKTNACKESLLKKATVPFQNVLLIDTQLKHPTLHTLFGVDIQPGLSDYLESRINLRASIRNIANSRLRFMPAGQMTEQPLYHLYFDVFYDLLERIKPYIYLILLDIPPLLEYAEGITLSKLCDGIILNIKSATTRWESVQEAKNLVEKANVKIVGTILNKRKSYVPKWMSRCL